MNKKVSKAMEICAKQVREIPCARCLHYEKCLRNGGSPVSMLGRYLAWLNLSALKPIEAELRAELRQYCAKGLKLEAHAPDIAELEEGAYAVVRAYEEGENPRLLFRLSLRGDEDEDALSMHVFDAFIRAEREMNDGK